MEVKIEKINNFGYGICHTESKKFRIPYTLEDEIVQIDTLKQNSKLIECSLTKIIKASTNRNLDIECPYYTKCGGCNLQHMNEETYKNFKKQIVDDAFSKLNFPKEKINMHYIPNNQRRRTVFHASRDQNGNFLFGYHKANTNEIVSIEKCILLTQSLNQASLELREYVEKFETSLLSTGSELRIALTECANGIDIVFTSNYPFSNKVKSIITMLPQDFIRASWIENGRISTVIFNRTEPLIKCDEELVNLPVGAFLQAANESQQILIDFIKDELKYGDTAIDLFSGIGTYSIAFKNILSNILAVEGKFQNDLTQFGIKTTQANLQTHPIKAAILNSYDIAIINPPRNGATNQFIELAKSGIKSIFVVSCNQQTFTRDAEILIKSGYQITKASAIDQFRFSSHIEFAAKFAKTN